MNCAQLDSMIAGYSRLVSNDPGYANDPYFQGAMKKALTEKEKCQAKTGVNKAPKAPNISKAPATLDKPNTFPVNALTAGTTTPSSKPMLSPTMRKWAVYGLLALGAVAVLALAFRR